MQYELKTFEGGFYQQAHMSQECLVWAVNTINVFALRISLVVAVPIMKVAKFVHNKASFPNEQKMKKPRLDYKNLQYSK